MKVCLPITEGRKPPASLTERDRETEGEKERQREREKESERLRERGRKRGALFDSGNSAKGHRHQGNRRNEQ